MKVVEGYQRYIDDCLVARGRSAGTIRTAVFMRNTAAKFFDGVAQLEDITIEIITDYVKFLSDGGRCHNTIIGHMTYLRLVLRHYRKLGGICIDPDLVPIGRKEEVEVGFVTPEEVDKMIQASNTVRDKLIISLLYSAGLRIFELCKLKIADFGEEYFRVKGKGAKVRVCFIDERTRALLDDYMKHRLFGGVYLFATQWTTDDSYISQATVRRVVEIARRRAGIEKRITPHAFRHGFATDLLNNGVAIQDVSEMLGHANIQTTMIYRHQTHAVLLEKYRLAHTV